MMLFDVQQSLLRSGDNNPVELRIASDMVKRGMFAAPIIVIAGGLIWGRAGAFSAAFGLALVFFNFLLAASIVSWAARISTTLVMAVSMFGYFARLALMFAIVYPFRNEPWISRYSLGLTMLIAHLGLLIWEIRFVSISLAYPGLKPRQPRKN